MGLFTPPPSAIRGLRQVIPLHSSLMVVTRQADSLWQRAGTFKGQGHLSTL